MRRVVVAVAMLVMSVATSSVVGRQRTTDVDSLVESRCWMFRPVSMQNPQIGTTREVYQYNVFFEMEESAVKVQMPVEWVSMSIFTEEFVTQAENYSSRKVEDDYWQILFTIPYGSESWAVEIAANPLSGRVSLALVAPEGVMRYIGALYALKRDKE